MTSLSTGQMYSAAPGQDGDHLALAAVSDPAFEPSANYLFDDLADEEEFRAMQRKIAAPNVLNVPNSQHALESVSGAHHEPNAVKSHVDQNLGDPFMFDYGSSPPWSSLAGPGLVHPPSVQSRIIQNRSGSASQQYGDITPPDDFVSDGHETGNTAYKSGTPEQVAVNAKSERARNAANHRHAKAKKARREGARKTDGSEGEDVEANGKRERYREKNRLAAAKCRAKKKVNTDELEISAREATSRNNQLKAEARELRDLFSSLRNHALAHDPTQGCNCQSIHAYNMHKAQQAARGVTLSLANERLPSPATQSISAASPITTETSSRAPSFSGGQPPCTKHPNHSLSTADRMTFDEATDLR